MTLLNVGEEYLFRIKPSENDYFLEEKDLDSSDVVLRYLFDSSLILTLPFNVANYSSEPFLSRDLSSSRLQALINAQVSGKRHRIFTQLREVRDHDFIEGHFPGSVSAAMALWAFHTPEHNHAEAFAEEYERVFAKDYWPEIL